MVDKNNNFDWREYVTLIPSDLEDYSEIDKQMIEVLNQMSMIPEGRETLIKAAQSEDGGKIQIAASVKISSSYRSKSEDKGVLSEIGREFLGERVFGDFD